MPTEDINEELYHIYDMTVCETLKMLVGGDAIRLSGFDRKDESHLFVLRVALMARNLYDIPVEIETDFWTGFLINWKLRKHFGKVKIVKHFNIEHFYLPNLVGKIRSTMRKESGVCIHLDSVYNTYYEGSCN